MAAGWIKLHRKIIDNPIMRDPILLQVWVWCLVKANYRDVEIPGRGTVCAGSFETTRHHAAEVLNMRPSTWQDAIRRLEKRQYVTLKTDNRKTTVTICNWQTYQRMDIDDPTTARQQTDNGPTTNRQPTDNPPIERRIKEPQEGENGDSEKNSNEIGWLIREWLHRAAHPAKAYIHDELKKIFEEMIRHGYTVERISAAIVDKNRIRTEWPSEFAKRMLGTKPEPPPETHEQRAARIARERAEREADLKRRMAE